jgi:hypothetical protein
MAKVIYERTLAIRQRLYAILDLIRSDNTRRGRWPPR